MNNILLVSIVESIYILYMYNIFKTVYYIHNPIELYLHKQFLNNSDIFRHPIYSGSYKNKICVFGKICSVILVLLIYARYYIIKNNLNDKIDIYYYTKIVLIFAIVLTFVLNMNSFVYLLPVILFELYILYNRLL